MQLPFVLIVATALAASATSHPSPPTPSPTPTRNVTILQPQIPIVPTSKLPAPHAASKSDQIVQLFKTIGRTTVWNLVDKVPFQGDMGEPEGIVRLGEDRYFVSAGQYITPMVSFNGSIINGTDRTPGSGFAHVKVFDGNGTIIADATISDPGSFEYHTGGFDYDGEYIWATIAQYRPNTTAHNIRIDPITLNYTVLFHADDHYGGSIHDTKTNLLYTLNWGSRNVSAFDLNDKHIDATQVLKPLSVVRNPSYFIDYQDCKFLGRPSAYQKRPVAICSGIAAIGTTTIGGVAIVDLESSVPLDETPMVLFSDLGAQINSNPMDVDVVNGRLRFYFMPDQHNATLYVYEAQPQSPFEF